MNILVVSATHFEIQPLLDFLDIKEPILGINTTKKNTVSVHIDVLITGIGMVETAFMMGKWMNQSYQLIINAGVCGAFNRLLKLGELVCVNQDILSELGAEDDTNFLPYNQLSLPGEYIFSSVFSRLFPDIDNLKKVTGITVNTIHGNEISINKILELYHPDIESMEGAAFFRACKELKSAYIQIRAISNYVEKRDKSKWQMSLAINNLNNFLISFIQSISNSSTSKIFS